MISKIHYGTVDKGKILWNDPKTLRMCIFQHEGKPVEIVIRRKRKKRSNPQNKYYRGVVIEILSEYCGYTPDEMHDAIKYKFLKKQTDGKPLTFGSTAGLTTIEFEELMSKIRIWASSELSVYIPEPNEPIEWTN